MRTRMDEMCGAVKNTASNIAALLAFMKPMDNTTLQKIARFGSF